MISEYATMSGRPSPFTSPNATPSEFSRSSTVTGAANTPAPRLRYTLIPAPEMTRSPFPSPSRSAMSARMPGGISR